MCKMLFLYAHEKYNGTTALKVSKSHFGGKVFIIKISVQMRTSVCGTVNKLFKMRSAASVLSNQDTLKHIKSCFEVNLS